MLLRRLAGSTFQSQKKALNVWSAIAESFHKHLQPLWDDMNAHIGAYNRFLSMEVKADEGACHHVQIKATLPLREYTSTIPQDRVNPLPRIVVLCGASGSGKSFAVQECARHLGTSSNLLHGLGDMLSTLLKWKGSDWTIEDCKGKKLMRVDCDVGDDEQQQASISWFNTCALGLPAKYRDTKFSQHVKNAFCINPSHVTLVLDNFDKHIMKDENKKTASYEFINSLQVDAGHSKIFNIIVVLSDPSNVFWMLDKFKGIATHVVVKWTEDKAVALLDAATVSPGPAVLDTMNNKQLSVHELMVCAKSVCTQD